MTLGGFLRALALAMAVAGVIDPAITASRQVKPDVALVTAARLPDPALVERVARALEPRFTVIRGASISIGAAAIVSVGDQLLSDAARHVEPAFAVLPEPRRPFVSITSVDAPSRAQLQARVPITVRVRTRAARGRQLAVTLESGGVSVDRMTRDITGDDTAETLELGLVATAAGAARYVVTARVDPAPDAARVDLALTAGDERWAVLFFDRRPSWMSTFARRAIEADPRFVVSSRVGTSRGVEMSAGNPPSALASLPSLEMFDVVIAGAPEDLTEADVSGLDAFMRARGGTVVIVIDAASEGRPFERLTGVTRWSRANRAEPSGEPLASEFFWPATMPLWAEPLTAIHGGNATSAPPAVWQTAVGRGRLVVGGALDAWRYRDRNAEGFDRFWRAAVAGAAKAAAVGVSIEATSPTALRLPTPDDRDRIRAWTSSRHGTVVPEPRLSELAPAIERALTPVSEGQVVHPMASAWWIAPFAVALGGEWWLRRRRGQR